MNMGRKNILRVRVISVGFSVLALAVFKPFGLEAWQWQCYVHLLAIFAYGMIVCLFSDALMKYVLQMSCSPSITQELPVSLLIRRNLYFQVINTALESLMICLYRHFMLSDRIPANRLSWGNYFETLIIIAFCSFAIGLYWRYKFRGKYLAAELEETRMLNERLKELRLAAEKRAKESESTVTEKNMALVNQAKHDNRLSANHSLQEPIVLSGTTNETVSLLPSNLLYIETVGNYVKVYHLRDGRMRTDMLRATSKQMEEQLSAYPMIVRCHRAFLVNLGQVEHFVAHSGSMQLVISHSHDTIPVSRSNITTIKAIIKKT